MLFISMMIYIIKMKNIITHSIGVQILTERIIQIIPKHLLFSPQITTHNMQVYNNSSSTFVFCFKNVIPYKSQDLKLFMKQAH